MDVLQNKFFAWSDANKLKKADPDSIFEISDARSSIVNIISDLFKGGLEPLALSFAWIQLYLLHFPDWQDIIFDEIETLTEGKRLPSLDDKSKAFQTNAFIAESLRKTGLFFAGLPRSNPEAIQVEKFELPAGTQILPNLYHILNDPEHWENPDEFNPRRFLNKDGSEFLLNERIFIPFSTGSRRCVGEKLAENLLFVLLATTVQNFRLESSKNLKKLPGIEANATDPTGILRTPPEFSIVFHPRK